MDIQQSLDKQLPVIMDSSSIDNYIDISAYHPLSDDVIGSLKIYARAVNAIDQDNVRLTERLYIPQKRLRGFNVLKVGPKDGEIILEEIMSLLWVLKLSYQILLPESTKTDVSVVFRYRKCVGG